MKAKSRSLIIVEYIRKCRMQTMKVIMLEAGIFVESEEPKNCHNYAESKLIQLKLFAQCVSTSVSLSRNAMQQIELYARIVNFASFGRVL